MNGVSAPPSAQSGFPLVYCQGEIIDVWEMGNRIRDDRVKLGRNVSLFQEKAALGLDWRDELPAPNMEERSGGGGLTLEEARDLIRSDYFSSGRPASQPGHRQLTEWEIYTLRFIHEYELNDEQTQKSLSILRECEERRRALEAVMKSKPDKCREQCDKLFEEQLKPRLERLLTRKQKEMSVTKENEP